MNNLPGLIWVEARKAIRSRLPLWTGLGSLFMPLGVALLIFVSRNPQISQQLGLVSAKADLLAYAATDWPAYLRLAGQMIAAGGFFLFVLVISWIFGREFADGTLKDLLAVPVSRASIVLAKFIVMVGWAAVLAAVILATSLAMGAAIRMPGGSSQALFQGSLQMLVSAALTVVAIFPFALFASIGRGYLLPVGLAVLTLMMANLVVVFGWGEYFPWAVAGLHALGKAPLPVVSYEMVLLTGLLGVLATQLWWKYADQNR